MLGVAGRTGHRGRQGKWVFRVGLVAAIAAFLSLALARAVQDGVCCADDALMAVAAKDLARGLGYPQGGDLKREGFFFSLSGGFVTVGPVIVLPVAAAIRLLGNRYWVPGVASITMWAFVFVLIVRALAPFGDTRRRDAALVLFLALCFAFTTWHFEHWYAMLGEVPASFLVWLAVVLWARRPRRRANLRVASLVLGLACLTKLLAALCIPPFLMGVALARGVRAPRRLGRVWRDVAASVFWILLPATCFQAYRAVAAGPDHYFEENRRWAVYVWDQATSERPTSDALTLAAGKARNAYERFGLGPVEALVLSSLALLIVLRRLRPHLQLQALVLLGCVLMNLTWWLFVSKGWPRYALIAVLLSLAAAVLPLFALRGPLKTLAYGSLLVASTIPNWTRLAYPLQRGPDGWFSTSLATRNAIEVVSRLDASDLSVYGPWWATIADLEYLSAHVGRYSPLPRQSRADASRRYAVAFNTRFQPKLDPVLEAWLSACRADEDDLSPYNVYWCGSTGAGPPPP